MWKTFLFQAIQFSQAVLIQLIQFSISTDFVYTHLNAITVLYWTIQFSVSTVSMSKNSSIQKNSFLHKHAVSSIWPIDRALSGATIPGQSGPENNGNEGVLLIAQSSSITGTSPSDCLMSYPGHSLVVVVVVVVGGLTPLQRSSQCILQPQLTGQYKRICWLYCPFY